MMVATATTVATGFIASMLAPADGPRTAHAHIEHEEEEAAVGVEGAAIGAVPARPLLEERDAQVDVLTRGVSDGRLRDVRRRHWVSADVLAVRGIGANTRHAAVTRRRIWRRICEAIVG